MFDYKDDFYEHENSVINQATAENKRIRILDEKMHMVELCLSKPTGETISAASRACGISIHDCRRAIRSLLNQGLEIEVFRSSKCKEDYFRIA